MNKGREVPNGEWCGLREAQVILRKVAKAKIKRKS